MEVLGHLLRGCSGDWAKKLEDAGVGNDEVEFGDAVFGFQNSDCFFGVGIGAVVDFDNDECRIGSFREAVEVCAGGGVADSGYDSVIWAGKEESEEAIADSCKEW